MQQVLNPYPIFLGLDGLALELGKIYIGLENQDPESSPKTVYWDEAGAETALQPIRTLAGYPDRNGSPAQMFTSGKYSIRVRDSQDNQVFYLASAGTTETVNACDPYFIHIQFLGDPPSVQQVVCKHVFGVAVSFEVDLPDLAYFHVGTVPGSDCEFAMRKNGVSYGTLTIDTSGDLLVVCDAQDFDIGDRFELTAPASSTSLADIGGTIIGATA